MGYKIRGSDLYSESAVYGLIVVSALLVIADDYENTALEVFLKVLGTVIVFWVAHLFAVAIAHLNQESKDKTTFRSEAAYAMGHSVGLLIAAVVPLVILLLGVTNIMDDDTALWTALWVDVLLLGVLGYFSARRWTIKPWIRLATAFSTALLGIFIVALKTIIH
ncbi:hypothetical protein [Arthrobacter cryoconiti]